jgi:hypothetical protein
MGIMTNFFQERSRLRDLGYKQCPDCDSGMAQPGHRICFLCEREQEDDWTDEDEEGLEDYEEDRRRKIAERNEY